jgi:pimeloyl-ACP methyl ester carboxylesterase
MHQFTRGNLTFPVRDSGESEGEAVVLLHGFPQDPASWDAVVPRLRSAGLRTLVPTQRGYVATARPARRADYRSAETAADVVALLDTAQLERAHIVGHDWGGAQGWAVAGLHPDRVASLTVLSTPHPAAFARALRTSDQGLRSWYVGLFQLPVLPEILAGATLLKTLTDSRLPAADVERYVAALRDRDTLTGALNWYRGMPFSSKLRAGRITVPTTYVWGRHDFALGRAAAEGTAEFVRAPYTFVELDSGHWLPETEPAAVADAILERVRS